MTAAVHPVRSYVLRNQRMTPAQRRALREDWPRFGVEPGAARLDLPRIFGRRAPVVLEIGCGNGDLLTQMAAGDPARDFLGVEVYRPGVGALLRKARLLALENLRVVCRDAVEVVCDHLKDRSIDQVMLMFPDPWPKKRHHKRRLVQTEFMTVLASRVRRRGLLYLATDWAPYAQAMRAEIERSGCYHRSESDARIERPQTAFEKRATTAGRKIFTLLYEVI